MARKASRKVPKRKPGTGSRKPPMSGYGAKPRSAKKAARDGATNFSPEPNRIGRDAMVTPQVFSSNYNMKTGQHDRYVVDTLRPITTSEHFEYGRQGGAHLTSEFHRTSRRQQAAHNRRVRGARNRGAYRAGDLRRRAR